MNNYEANHPDHSGHEDGSLIARNTSEEKATLEREMRHIEMKLFCDSINVFAPYYHQHTMDAMSLEKITILTRRLSIARTKKFYNTLDPANKKFIYNLNSTDNYSRVVKTK